MIQRTIDFMAVLAYVLYARMSDPSQNKSSPDQQFREIRERIARAKRPWRELMSYRDDGISGRLIKKRPGFQSMLRDIELEVIKPDLILVDTAERFGRADEMAEIRRKLYTQHGVVLLTANSDFADPTGPLGKAMAASENNRTTEDSQIKAHNVVRGKKDSVLNGKWPGGPPPFGFRLKRVEDPTNKRTGFYSVLDPIPEILVHLAALSEHAARTGEGPDRQAGWWNSCDAIPASYKPISPSTIRYMQRNEIYVGVLAWGKNNTDIIDDVRVLVPNPHGPSAVNETFCAPSIDPDLKREVDRQRKIRSEAHRANRPAKDEPANALAPLARGLTLKYLLAGLVRCAHCGSAMRTVPSCHTEKGPNGDKVYRYVHHSCPRSGSGACVNHKYIREEKLRAAVVGHLRARLFPLPSDGGPPGWLPELVGLIEADIASREERKPDRSAARASQLTALEKLMKGWMISLGDPDLATTLRKAFQESLASATAEAERLRIEAQSEIALESVRDRLINPKVAINALRGLHEVLAGENPTLGNLELSKHIDRVDCYADGKVVLHGTMLGVLGEGAILLTRTGEPEELQETTPGQVRITPRLRSRRYVANLSAQDRPEDDQTRLLDPTRFEGYGDEFFWQEELYLQEDLPWYRENAEAVARERVAGKTHEALARQFSVTVPTIRAALKHAYKIDPTLATVPKKMARARWQDSHYVEVAAREAEGQSVAVMSAHFGVSEPLIRSALIIAAEKAVAHESGASGIE